MLIARESQLNDLLRSAATPDSSVLLVGPYGSGRSHLLREVQRRAPVRSVLITPSWFERHTPLSGLSLILNGLGDPRVAEFVGRFVLADDSTDGAVAAARDVLAIVRGLSVPPVVIIVDDIDLLDDTSQTVISYMASRLTGTGVRIVAAAAAVGGDSPLNGFHRVDAPRLTPDELFDLATSARPDADSQTLRMITDRAGGLPGLMMGALESLSPDQLAGHAALSLPLRPVAGSAHELDDDTRRVLSIVSTAPVHTVSAIVRAAGIDRSELEQFVARGFLELIGRHVRLRDGSLRSELYWGMTLAERRDLHRASAQFESAHSEHLSAWHTDHLDEATPATTQLLIGATAMLRLGAVESSIEFCERALLLEPEPGPHVAALLDYCALLVDRGEFGLGNRYLAQSRLLLEQNRDILRWKSIEVVARALADEPVDENEVDVYVNRFTTTDPEACAELLDTVAVFLAEEGDIDAARSRVDQADLLLPGTAATSRDLRRWAPRLVEALGGDSSPRIAPSIAELQGMPISSLLACGHSLSMEEHYDDARQVLTMLAMTLPNTHVSSAWLTPTLALVAENEQRAGHFNEASISLDRVVASGAPLTFRSLLLLAWRSLLMGERLDAEPYLEELRSRTNRTHRESTLAHVSAVTGSAALMEGNLDEAVRLLGHAFNAAPELRPGVLRVEHDYVEALQRAGDLPRARRAVDAFAAKHNRRPSGWSSMALARARATVADEPDVIPAFELAITLANRSNSAYEVARTRLGFATALTRFGRVDQAREERRASTFLFDAASAPGWMRHTYAEPNDTRQPPVSSMLATLTDDELAVLRLIRRGVRNKDIASSLFVSLRTVEVRITRIYRKLEARSRSHLLALLPSDADLLEPH